MAVYRPDAALLSRQIESIKSQTVTNWRCVVAIDGLDEAARRQLGLSIGDDQRFTILEFRDNVGFYRNFERSLSAVEANSEWVALSDQDDFWYPRKLEMLIPALETSSLVSGTARLVDESGRDLGVTSREFRGMHALFIDNQVTGSLSVFRRSLLDIALPFPEGTDVAYHDHWLGVVAAAADGVVMDRRVVQDYVQHATNVIGEERSGKHLGSRLRHLFAAGGARPADAWRYLAVHRWGWRVHMAQALTTRVPSSDASVRPFQTRGPSAPTARAIICAVARGNVPAGRGISLLLGSLRREKRHK
jgi:hypothetical protein